METGLIIINGVLLVLLAIWAMALNEKAQRLEIVRTRLSRAAEKLRAMLDQIVPIECEYRFSDSDYNKTEAKMTRDARERITAAVGRRVVKAVGLEEIVEHGTVVGYRADLEVRKTKPIEYGEDN